MRVITRDYSSLTDVKTGVEFKPVLVQDRSDDNYGCWIGSAQVTGEQADDFAERRGFEVLTEADFVELTQIAAIPPPSAPITGDPITDNLGTTDGPPASPSAGTAPAAVTEGANAPSAASDSEPPAAPPSS